MRPASLGTVLLCLGSGVTAMAEDQRVRTASVYPGVSWERRVPEDVGLSRAKLDAFRDIVGGRGCVVRHGYMVYTWGNVSKRGDIASAAKPWYSHFLFKALEDGKIPSLDQKVVEWEPLLNDLKEKHAVTAVTSPLPNAIPRAGKRAADMIPGQRTMGSRSIPDNQCDHLGSYSWLWWTNGTDRNGKRHWPDVPADAYGCFGHGGPRAMVVIPGLDVVMSWNDAQVRGRERENRPLKLLVKSVVLPVDK